MTSKERIIHKLLETITTITKFKEDFKSYEIKNYSTGDYIINIKIDKK